MSSLQDFLMIKVYWRLYKSQSFLPNIFSLWSTKIFAHCGHIAHWHSLAVGPHMYQSLLQALFRHVLSHTSLPNCWRQSILKLGSWHRKTRAWRELDCCVISQRCSLVRIRRHQTKHLYGNFVQTTLAVYTLVAWRWKFYKTIMITHFLSCLIGCGFLGISQLLTQPIQAGILWQQLWSHSGL